MIYHESDTYKKNIIQIIPANNWYYLSDWDGYDEYVEEPVVCFALCDINDNGHKYQYVRPMVQNYANYDNGVEIEILDKDSEISLEYIIEVYHGKGNYKTVDSLKKPTK